MKMLLVLQWCHSEGLCERCSTILLRILHSSFHFFSPYVFFVFFYISGLLNWLKCIKTQSKKQSINMHKRHRNNAAYPSCHYCRSLFHNNHWLHLNKDVEMNRNIFLFSLRKKNNNFKLWTVWIVSIKLTVFKCNIKHFHDWHRIAETYGFTRLQSIYLIFLSSPSLPSSRKR